MNFKVEFKDHDDVPIYMMLRDWANMINGANESLYEDADIKEIVESGEPTIIANNGTVHLYSTGIKKNGKIDICIEHLDTNEKKFYYDCTATMPENQVVESQEDEFSTIVQSNEGSNNK